MDVVDGNAPAARVIEKCGGIERTAELVGRHRSVVNRWLRPKDKGGTGGLVPAEHQQTLIREARLRGIELCPDDFFPRGPAGDSGGPRATGEKTSSGEEAA